jgi:thioesterase domain-containing protein
MSPLKQSVWQAYLHYEAAPYTAPVSLFYLDGSAERSGGDPSLRWSKYLRGGFELIRLEGHHRKLFDPPFVEPLAWHLSRSLEAAVDRRRRTHPPG